MGKAVNEEVRSLTHFYFCCYEPDAPALMKFHAKPPSTPIFFFFTLRLCAFA